MGILPKVKYSKRRTRVVLLLGSNQGNPEYNLLDAINRIESFCGNVLRVSPIYLTEPWGITDQAKFLNQALLLDTLLPPLFLMKKLLAIELQLGRVRNRKWGPRTIDIDILVYGNRLIQHNDLQIPHIALHERRFALVPLEYLWRTWKHPSLGTNATEMLALTKDKGEVKRLL
jgi:2-amino-4-hydroxy-6-hydroxymethyldihydropteridine diphosphokinase